MKIRINYLAFVVIAALVFATSCDIFGGGGDPPTCEQEMGQDLEGTWSVAQATVPANVSPTLFDDLQITFSATNDGDADRFQATGTNAAEVFGSSSLEWEVISCFDDGSRGSIQLFGNSPVERFDITIVGSNATVEWGANDMNGRVEVLGDYTIIFNRSF